MQIKTQNIGVREFTADDVEAVLAYRADPEVKQFDTFGVNSESDVKAILAKAAAWAAETPRTRYFGAVYETATGDLIGECALYLHPGQPAGELGIMLHKSKWGQGYAAEVLNALEKFAVSLGLTTLSAQCHRDNARAKNMLAKFNMTQEREINDSLVWSKEIQ